MSNQHRVGWIVLGSALLLAILCIVRPAETTTEAAEQAYQAGDYATAERLFAQDPSPRGRFNHAASLYELGRFDDAARDYASAGEERTPRASYDLGNCLLQKACATAAPANMRQLLEQAVSRYQTALDQAHDDPLKENALHNQELARRLLARSIEEDPELCPHCKKRQLAALKEKKPDAAEDQEDTQETPSQAIPREESKPGKQLSKPQEQQAMAEEKPEKCPT